MLLRLQIHVFLPGNSRWVTQSHLEFSMLHLTPLSHLFSLWGSLLCPACSSNQSRVWISPLLLPHTAKGQFAVQLAILCPLCYLHYLCILIQSLLPSELQQQPSLLRCPHTFSDPSSTHFYWKLLKRQMCYHLLTDSKIKMRTLPCRSLWAHLLGSHSFFFSYLAIPNPMPCQVT